MLKSTLVYLTSSVINRAIPFFLLPILTRYLTPYEYGMLAIFQVFLTFTTPLVDLNVSQNIVRKFHRLSKEELSRYMSNIALILLTAFSIVLIITAAVVLLTDNFFQIPDRWLMVIPIMALMNMVNKCNLTVFIQERRPYKVSMFEIGTASLNMAVSLVLVVGYHMGWQGRASALLVTSIVLGLIGLGFIVKRGYFQRSYSRDSVKEILSVSLPTLPHALGMVVIGYSDRLFINSMVETGAVGLYDVGYKVGMVTMLFADAFMKTWSPWFFKNIASGDQRTNVSIVRRSYLFMIGMFILAFVLTYGARMIFPYFVSTTFAEAAQYIIWIALAYSTRSIYQLMQFYLLYHGRMRFLPVNTLTAAAVNVGLNYYLITVNGPIGAAQASLIAFTVMSLGTWWYAQRIHQMPWFSFKELFTRR